ncbi:unnamed protein product, partial [Oppiella nova]
VIRHVITGNASTGILDEPFYVVDVEDIIEKHRKLVECIPRVQPYYAVKCNPSPVVLQLLAGLGVGFDCASKGEIERILSIGVPANRIIYANTCKSCSYIQYAEEVGVNQMTFDNEHELYKVRQLHPGAEMLLRIRVDDHYSRSPLGTKFGASLKEVRHLLVLAKQLDVNVVGCCFHVGSGCQKGESYTKAIADAKWVFKVSGNIGFDMRLLDIGGGFVGATSQAKFQHMAQAVNSALDLHFPDIDSNGYKSSITIISEFGRYYVDSAMTLATTITSKRCFQSEDYSQPPEMMYYLNDGIYGSFVLAKLGHVEVEPIPLDMGTGMPINERPLYSTTLWGPTCDSLDYIKK